MAACLPCSLGRFYVTIHVGFEFASNETRKFKRRFVTATSFRETPSVGFFILHSYVHLFLCFFRFRHGVRLYPVFDIYRRSSPLDCNCIMSDVLRHRYPLQRLHVSNLQLQRPQQPEGGFSYPPLEQRPRRPRWKTIPSTTMPHMEDLCHRPGYN